eukprot:CAMPEP_0184366156 /NCGR_PEP_ID=MMETSP1089-20130417/152379_1 /TAXON_ID=38269 ORGANISM="Gloeochaete wittrockiana, Strain SAG46.84" /NCGR_SAMPLE_ID=MMETSP1089 /ASSEMBLY_ACC=CAM_ASM_000445 /LENGTH=126 /DNA_ID=CAMNT_0026707647 /DNA_START=9 /DNA_END=389 /DNA_ORIENTATION=-
MCKHILNAQVSIRAPCCRKWYDCAACHEILADHPLKKHFEMVFACKKCKHVFRKDTREWDEADEFCPHCDNHYWIEAKTPEDSWEMPVAGRPETVAAGGRPNVIVAQSDDPEELRRQGFTDIRLIK